MEKNVVKNNNKKNWVLIALIVSLIVIVVLLIVIFVGGGDSNQLDNDSMMNGESVLDENEVNEGVGDIATDVDFGETDEDIDFSDINDSQVDSSFDVPSREEPEYIEEPIEGIELVTPYITFYYPEEWLDSVEVVQINEEANYTLTFSAKISDNYVELFSIYLGHDSIDGYLLGQLADDNVNINVIVDMNEIDNNDWTYEEFATISSMQERVNDMIGQLHEDERFIPV